MATNATAPAVNLQGMTQEQLIALIGQLQEKKQKRDGSEQTENGLTLRVGDKGGVSVFGLGRFPVTLYDTQWDKLTAAISDITDFRNRMRAEGKLAVKPAKESK